MRHMAFITGTADFLNLYSYLLDRKLLEEPLTVVLFGNSRNVSSELLATARRLTEILPAAAFDYLDLDQEGGIESIVAKHLAADARVEKLLITHLFGAKENQILDVINRDKLVLIENGLATYLPPLGRDPRFQQDYYGVRPLHAVQEAWLPLAPVLGAPFYLPEEIVEAPSIESFRRAALAITDALNLKPLQLQSEERVMFVAGTSLYRLKVLSHADESAAYQLFIEDCLENGYDRVCWKPHPRMLLPMQELPTGKQRVETIADSLPMELRFLEAPEGAGCGSIASSAIFLGSHYFDIEPTLLPADFGSIERFPHLESLDRWISPHLR